MNSNIDGGQNETTLYERQGKTSNEDGAKAKSQTVKIFQAAEQEETIVSFLHIDKTIGESRFWQIVGALLFLFLTYLCIFVL